MPTGYTHNIKDGISFKKFVLQCARAFGALIDMRDAPFDAPIPDEIKVDDYHKKSADNSRKELKELENMSPKEIEKACEKQFEQALKDWNEINKEKLNLLAKYQKKLEEANAWIPPTKDHEALKEFMIQQITDSIKWDCDVSLNPVKMTVEKYVQDKRDTLEWSIDYHTKEYAEEVKRAEARTAWIRDLKKSL